LFKLHYVALRVIWLLYSTCDKQSKICVGKKYSRFININGTGAYCCSNFAFRNRTIRPWAKFLVFDSGI
jgi:hypothetical protein